MRPRLPHGAPRSPTRTGTAAAAMVALLAVASLATRGGGGDSTAPPGTGAVTATGRHVLIVAAIVLAPILAVMGAAFFMYAQIYRRRELDPEEARRRRAARVRAAAVGAVFLGLIAFWLRTGRNPLRFLHLRNPFRDTSFGHPAGPGGHLRHPPTQSVSTADWTLAAVVWVALLATAALVYWRSRARLRPTTERHAREADEETAEPDLDALRRERNPRRAVIAAYAAMERHMARDGLPRGAHEAPMEYLGRVTLAGHERVSAVHRLTALFQRARFSHRPVDEDMRGRAISAVEELAADTGDPA